MSSAAATRTAPKETPELAARRRKYITEQLAIADAALDKARRAAATMPQHASVTGIASLTIGSNMVLARGCVRASTEWLEMLEREHAATAGTAADRVTDSNPAPRAR